MSILWRIWRTSTHDSKRNHSKLSCFANWLLLDSSLTHCNLKLRFNLLNNNNNQVALWMRKPKLQRKLSHFLLPNSKKQRHLLLNLFKNWHQHNRRRKPFLTPSYMWWPLGKGLSLTFTVKCSEGRRKPVQSKHDLVKSRGMLVKLSSGSLF